MNIISENDLYKFIFYPEELNPEKLNYIKNNLDLFKFELDLLSELSSNLEADIPTSISDKINAKLESQNKAKIILLEKETRNFAKESTHYVLAADSPSAILQERTQTFKDKHSSYLAKVVSGKVKDKLFVFAKDEAERSSIYITFYPSKNSFRIDLNELPFHFSKENSIESIEIRVK